MWLEGLSAINVGYRRDLYIDYSTLCMRPLYIGKPCDPYLISRICQTRISYHILGTYPLVCMYMGLGVSLYSGAKPIRKLAWESDQGFSNEYLWESWASSPATVVGNFFKFKLFAFRGKAFWIWSQRQVHFPWVGSAWKLDHKSYMVSLSTFLNNIDENCLLRLH